MKFDNNTLKILKNFSSINSSIVFRPGNVIATISASKSVMAKATVNENFDKEFGIYDLPRFLSTLTLFEDAEVELNEKFMTIKKDRSKVNYNFSDPSVLISPPVDDSGNVKELKLPSEDVKVTIKESDFAQIQKGLSVLQLPEIALVGKEGLLHIMAVDSSAKGKENKVSDSFSIEIGESDADFIAVFKAENLNLIPGDYDLTISKVGFSKFVSENLTYWVAVEKNKSEF